MASINRLHDLLQTASVIAHAEGSGSEAVHTAIYDLVMHAFMSEVLTLGRITRVVEAVRSGIEDCASSASGIDQVTQAKFESEAYRGLCTAATEGLIAVGLAKAGLCKLGGRPLSAELSRALRLETLECKQQLDQLTVAAGWPARHRINRIQAHWFDQLLQQVEGDNARQEPTSARLWSHVFFQSCGYEVKSENSDVHASLMLLGLLSSGALIGLKASYISA